MMDKLDARRATSQDMELPVFLDTLNKARCLYRHGLTDQVYADRCPAHVGRARNQAGAGICSP